MSTEDTYSTALPAKRSADSGPRAPMALKGRVLARRQGLVIAALIFSDIVLAALFWVLGVVLQDLLGKGVESGISVALGVSTIMAWVAMRAVVGLYPGYGMSPAEELRRQTYATIATLAMTAILAFGLQVGDLIPRLLLGLNFLERLLLAPVGRHFVKRGLAKLGLWGKPVVVLGAGEVGTRLVQRLKEEWGLGYKPVAAFDFHLGEAGKLHENGSYGGTVAEALSLARRRRLDTAIFAMPHVRREYLARFVDGARYFFRHVIVVPNLAGVTTAAVEARDFVGTFGVEIKQNLLNPWTLRTKRALDLGLTIVGGALILPLILTLSLLVWAETRGPVFYRARRMGKDGTLFSCLKFQTMVPEAEVMLQRMLEEREDLREEYGKYHKLRDDPRVTRIGKFLRKTSLDELPQLWNVLRGEMSLVGPRPYLPRETEDIWDSLHAGRRSLAGPRSSLPGGEGKGEDEEGGSTQNEILQVPPGITGPWQISGRNHTSFEERVGMDAYYVRNWSIWMDIIILARTFVVLLFRGSGAY
ncbi:MAG: sugar transferase [Actinomycetota bacterium]|nr:sugar transferase [Actinomycetota bacterium]